MALGRDGAILIAGQRVTLPGVEVVTYADDPRRVPRVTDGAPRRTWVRAVVFHTVTGNRGPLEPGGLLSERDMAYARYQAGTDRDVSWDFTIDTDGSIAQSNDPTDPALPWYTWHAGAVNGYTVGIEMVQGPGGALYQDQLRSAVALADALTRELGIQRQIPWSRGEPDKRIIPRLRPEGGNGRDLVGIYGHRNQTENRGAGDPGDWIFRALDEAGYEGHDFVSGDDLGSWRGRQSALGLPLTGIPGPETVEALARAGRPRGQWVPRPGDAPPRSRAWMGFAAGAAAGGLLLAAALLARD